MISKGIYKHYKGGEYEVMGVGRDSESLELVVIYRALYESEEFGPNAIWVRPLKMFEEMVEVDGLEQPRFKKID